MEEYVRAHVIIRGRVQGVFFRMETQRAAERYGVSGWVRNKSDGTVEAVFEGKKSDTKAALQWCHEGPAFASVESVEVEWEDYRGEPAGFQVTY